MKFKPSPHSTNFRKIAKQYQLTYYGTIDPTHSPDYLSVRGVTASPDQLDYNYCAGTIYNYPVQLLQRRGPAYLNDGAVTRRTWTVCQVTLPKIDLPHIFISSRDRISIDDYSIANFLPLSELKDGQLPITLADGFLYKCAVYYEPIDGYKLSNILTPEFQAMLTLHFRYYDIELFNNKLIIYSTKQPPQPIDLDKQLRLSIWLARFIYSLHLS